MFVDHIHTIMNDSSWYYCVVVLSRCCDVLFLLHVQALLVECGGSYGGEDYPRDLGQEVPEAAVTAENLAIHPPTPTPLISPAPSSVCSIFAHDHNF